MADNSAPRTSEPVNTVAGPSRLTADPTGGRPVVPRQSRLRPLGLEEVRITGGFWGERQRTNAEATLEHCLGWMDRTGWIGNFRAAVEGRLPADRAGREFSDSEIYKLLEALSWEAGRSGDPAARAALARLVPEVAAAQDGGGYLNTMFGRPGQRPRYHDLEWGHELYCFGHLVQASVARARTAGADELVSLGIRAADHVCAMFGPGGNEGVCGHPEIEMALVELFRVTGEQRYLDQAVRFVARRGRPALADTELGREYYQDDVPVRQARAFRGHAVRALYLACGAVDLAVETGDGELLDAVIRQWETTVARRTYLTGGMGAHHAGEAFGADFALPPDRAYSETCAGIASVMLSWRLLLATGDSRYADLAERTLYNVVATAVAPDGRAFYYTNTLHQRVPGTEPPRDQESRRASSSLRAPWFSVSCCPTNIARTFASLGAYLATADPSGLQIHQYADARIRTTLDDGRGVGVDVRTGYPNDGSVTVEVTESDGAEWTISLRVPAWAGEGTVLTDRAGRRPVAPGMVSVTAPFTVGERVRLELPVTARWTWPDPRVDAVRGTVAVERGPLVYCAESPDLPARGDMDRLRVDASSSPAERDGAVLVRASFPPPPESPWPYGSPTGEAHSADPLDVPLIPYHSWANRGPSTMRVWLPANSPTAPT